MGVSSGSQEEDFEKGEKSPAGETGGLKLQHTAVEKGELQGDPCASSRSSRSPSSFGAKQRKAGPLPQRRRFSNPAGAKIGATFCA